MTNKPKGNDPTPTKGKVRVPKLDTVGKILSEMGRLYRQARKGEIDPADASKLNTILVSMRQGFENANQIEELLAQLGALKAAVEGKPVEQPNQQTRLRPAA